MKQTLPYMLCVSVLVMTVGSGCSDSGDAITSDMHEDFDHKHEHQHGGNNDHEHDHEDGFEGTHSHGHTHGHRHGKPLHGGKVVSVGHTHHKDGATHFHAEIMPLVDNTICFHLQTETEDGKSRDYPIEDPEIIGVVTLKGRDSLGSEHAFVGAGKPDRSSMFSLVIPDLLAAEGDEFLVMIPNVRLGGQRQNFSFSVSRPDEDSANAEDGSEDDAPEQEATNDE